MWSNNRDKLVGFLIGLIFSLLLLQTTGVTMMTLTDNGTSLEMRLFGSTCSIKPSPCNQSRNFDRRNSQCGNDRHFSRPVVAGIEDEFMYTSVEEEQQEVNRKLEEVEEGI